jgi:hypothetical protein
LNTQWPMTPGPGLARFKSVLEKAGLPVPMLPALPDVTPDTVAGLLGAVAGPAALADAALQLAALTALGGLLSPDGLPADVIKARCTAAAAGTEWVCAAADAHATHTALVEQALFIMRQIYWAVDDSRPLVLPAARAALVAHPSVPGVVEQALACLAALAAHAGTAAVLMEEEVLVPAVHMALVAHGGAPGVVQQGLACLTALAYHGWLGRDGPDGGAAALLGELSTVRSALAAHAGEPGVTERGLACLAAFAQLRGDTDMVAELPAVRAALTAHAGVPAVVEQGLSCLANMAVHGENAGTVMAELPTIRAALVAHVGEVGVVAGGLSCLACLAIAAPDRAPLLAALPEACGAAFANVADPDVAMIGAEFFTAMAVKPPGLFSKNPRSRLRAAGVAGWAAAAAAAHPDGAAIQAMCRALVKDLA